MASLPPPSLPRPAEVRCSGRSTLSRSTLPFCLCNAQNIELTKLSQIARPDNQILERDTSSSKSNVLPVQGRTNAKARTSIAAINDGTTRYLVYQDSNIVQNGKRKSEQCSIVVNNLETMEGKPVLIPNSANVIDTEAVQIAAVYTGGEKPRIFVDHTDKNGRVYRSESPAAPGQALHQGARLRLQGCQTGCEGLLLFVLIGFTRSTGNR